MLVYSSARYERNGYGDMVYKRDAICEACDSRIGTQECYNPKKEKYSFKNCRDIEKNKYKFCPYCGKMI